MYNIVYPDSCNNRGVCLRASGQCACYGNCPADATLYDGTCLDVSVGMSPHISSASNCEVCEAHWGPNLDIWQGSCTFYCNPAATAEDQLPQDCYVGNTIRDECVFCSGRASNCSSISGQPECSCEGDYTGKYCQNACGSCNNGVCEENKLYNFFLLDTPEYAKTGDNSFKCTCAPDLIDRVTFEEEMYDLVTHDLSKERTFQDIQKKNSILAAVVRDRVNWALTAVSVTITENVKLHQSVGWVDQTPVRRTRIVILIQTIHL